MPLWHLAPQVVEIKGHTVGKINVLFAKGLKNLKGGRCMRYACLFAAILLFFIPLVPGVRDIPRYLKLYRFIYRYPVKGDFEKPAWRERHGATHGGEVEVVGGGD